MANKLKDMKFTSVDLVKRGANQDAHIRLFKSFDGGEEETLVQKSENTMSVFTDVLEKSFSSILNDENLSDTEAQEMMAKSLEEFYTAVDESVIKSIAPQTEQEREVDEMKINRKNLTKEESDKLDELLKKACKTEKADGRPTFPPDEVEEEDEEDDFPPANEKKTPAVKKSALPKVVQDAMDRMEEMQKSMEMKEFEELAKKYNVLGEDEEQLAKTLYDMKHSSEENYNAYVAVLDKSLEMVNNSGLFGEIGKSAAGGYYGSVSKSAFETKTEELMKSHDLTYDEAVIKAWEQNPDLVAEYDKAYAEGRF